MNLSVSKNQGGMWGLKGFSGTNNTSVRDSNEEFNELVSRHFEKYEFDGSGNGAFLNEILQNKHWEIENEINDLSSKPLKTITQHD